jgi:hypothetical protein
MIMQYLIIIMADFKAVFCSSEFPWARERISSKFMDILAGAFKKVRQPWSRKRTVR